MKCMTMSYSSGVLVLTYLPKRQSLYKLVAEAARCVSNVLYIDLWSDFSVPPFLSGKGLPNQSHTPSDTGDNNGLNPGSYYNLMKDIYQQDPSLTRDVDVRVLLPPAREFLVPRTFSSSLDVCIGSMSSVGNLMEFEHLVSKKYQFNNNRFAVQYISAVDDFKALSTNGESKLNGKLLLTQYPGVVIGGTFDHVHSGHKLLIGAAALLSTKKFTAGVSEGPMLDKKTLKELITPLEDRISFVKNFVEDVRPGLQLKIVGLTDSVGPSGTDDDLQLLVVSEETAKGIDVVNQVRAENGLHPLHLHVIDLISNENDIVNQPQSLAEAKMSSSQRRVQLLGTLRKNPTPLKAFDQPYVIGLTGGIASGKSALSKRLQKLGAGVINCDKLGHQAYSPGKLAYKRLVEEYGTEILNEFDDTINRRKLGSIVFSDRDQLKKLNAIVWPEIASMVCNRLKIMWQDGIKVCVVEAAVLFEAGWDNLCNEVWVSFVPREEAIRRIVERDSLTHVQAEIRVDAQAPNQERVDKAHVVLSTLWEPEFTQKQVEKAWKSLTERLPASLRMTTSGL